MNQFILLDKCMSLYSRTVLITTRVPKKFKMNYVKVLQNLAEDVYMSVYRGNNLDGDNKINMFKHAYESSKIYEQFLIQAQIDECLTIEQQCTLADILNEVLRILNSLIKK